MTISKFFNKITTVITIILVVWLGLNFMEINIKNTRMNPVYNKGNIIVMLIEWMDGGF